MGLGDWMRGQLIDIIEWTDPGDRTLVWSWPHPDHEIKNGARLVVREGQAALFLYEGTLADVFLPGTHTLTTRNLPVLGRLAGWSHGFESPFKCEVCFVNIRQFLDLKWGTLTPIAMRDPDFGAVRVRAYGVYSVQVLPEDVAVFFRAVVGPDRDIDTGHIEGQLRAELVAAFTEALGNVGVGVLDLARDQDTVAEACQAQMSARFAELGLSLTRFVVQSVSVPEAVEQAIDQRASMNAVGDLDEYAKFQAARALGRGAGSTGGLGAAPTTPDPATRLKTLKGLLDAGLIDDAAFAARRDQILAEI